MTKFNKFLVALGGAVTILGSALGDGSITGSEITTVVLAFVSAGLVWLVPNDGNVVE